MTPGLRLKGSVRSGPTMLLRPIDLTVPGGAWTCLLGPSGVGKSTVLHCFSGLDPGLRLQGEARAEDGRSLAGRVALMAQADMLAPWLSLLDNVMLGARLRRERAEPERARRLLHAVGLEAEVERKPQALSGGQRQRAALARTLYEDRPVILLDEPFSALDVGNRARMQSLAAGALKGRTVLHVTHDPAEAARLGEHLLLLTANGLCTLSPPEGAIPRPPDCPRTLATTGELTRRLMETA
ncbi:ABC transporter ATP-binding protein [Haematobacter massiliensis]|uniref:ABC transporter ATPase n=2 Tax=Haematobacter massiliensis TaxID=195105 RepID=A0A086Y501_9RHOB|nr:ABC transporter ATPase [Haematobacter massiliensis]OWJ71161.1 ABC transporter ATP-binding protein [Haematobacter massiliensis]OWJ84301.1 ABC transporter ATP-binding protein [Haematobacter massiliensis]QBJ25968.1 ATP-binding cassette domain-containing protein [Haematobacter massiliensis]